MSTPQAPSRASTGPAALTDTDRAARRAALVEALADQQAQIADHLAAFDELTGQPDTDSILEREMAGSGTVRAQEAIADIELALRRLDEGGYGTCEECGEPIAAARLEAIPHARHCVDCSGLARGPVS